MKMRYLFVSLLVIILLIYSFPRILIAPEDEKAPLKVSKLFPSGEGVDIETLITLELESPLDHESIEGKFSLHPEVPGRVTVEGEKIVFIPEFSLAYDTRYLVTLAEGVRDILGNVLEETFSIEFVTKPKPTIKIKAVGDVLLDGVTEERLREYDPAYPFALVREVLREGDVVFANLESPISDRGEPLPDKKFTFRANPFAVDALIDGGINIVSLANNHIMDYGQEALEDTLEILDGKDIHHAGAGRNATEAHKGTVMRVDGYKVGLLAYTDDFAVVPQKYRPLWQPGENKAGAALVHDQEKIKDDIKRLRGEVDLLIVSFHWGYEYLYTVVREQRELALLAVDNGADLILGHHPHIPQGIEIYKNKPIVYSMGNFVFTPNPRRPQARDTFIFSAEFYDGEIISMAMIPTKIENSQPYFPQGEELRELTSLLTGLLDNLSTGYNINNGIIEIEMN